MSPRSALPPHIDEPHEWKNTDWDTKWQRWMLEIKHWFAFGPRATEWWARWRKFPIVLFARKGRGKWRLEDDVDDIVSYKPTSHEPGTYLSTIQYWCRWHIALQWPLHLTFHIYWRAADVPGLFERPRKDLSIHHMFFFRIGARRDADKVYWFPSLFVGGNWN